MVSEAMKDIKEDRPTENNREECVLKRISKEVSSPQRPARCK